MLVKVFKNHSYYKTFLNKLIKRIYCKNSSDFLIWKSDHFGVGILCLQCFISFLSIFCQAFNYFSTKCWLIRLSEHITAPTKLVLRSLFKKICLSVLAFSDLCKHQIPWLDAYVISLIILIRAIWISTLLHIFCLVMTWAC